MDKKLGKLKNILSKKMVIYILISVAVFLSITGFAIADSNQNKRTSDTVDKIDTKPEIAICDGTKIISDCEIDNVKYKTYRYIPAQPEKSHQQTTYTDEEVNVGVCTLCNDGTFSPSCAVGRGACSHHGGVDQYDVPQTQTRSVPKTTTIVDSPAIPEGWEKIPA